MNDDVVILVNYLGLEIRLTAERREHILDHPEMAAQFDRIAETIREPETVVATLADNTVHVYQRYYETTPVTSKFLQVIVKVMEADAFILTAFFSRREKKGVVIWTA